MQKIKSVLFNSIEYVIFLPIVVMLFYLLPHRFRWMMLLVASCTFYMWFVPKYILILLITIIVDYSAGILMEKYADNHKLKKRFLVISIVSTCLVLFIFKYLGFVNDNLVALCQSLHINLNTTVDLILPIGLSFHTFQSMSYVIEVYRGNQKAERNFGIYSLYVMFFPQLVTGPIERPGNLLRQLREEKKYEYDNISKGFRLIIFGLFIKMVVADNVGAYVDMIYADPSKYNSWDIILGMFFYSFQIYGDFFGYSTIALGSAKLMGFDITDNFNTPYLAKSIAEFWHRWHISLSTWFRDYVYFPLGGSRVKFGRWAFNIMVVFVLSGIWHGAAWNFLIWGAAHGLLHIIEKAILNHLPEKNRGKLEKIVVDAFKIAKTFILVTLFWSLFRATSFANISDLFTSLVSNFNTGEHLNVENSIWIYLGLFILLDVLLFNSRFDKWCDNRPAVIRWAIYFVLIFMIIACSSVNNFPFIYFQF